MSAAASVFGIPVRQPDQTFYIPLTQRIPLQIRVSLTAEGVSPTLEHQPKFMELQTRMLNELVKNRQLYRTPPTLESLQYMTSAWGFIKNGKGEIQVSPSNVLKNNIPASQWPCIVDFVLEGLILSRSSIQPVFSLMFIEAAGGNVIDFDWGAAEPDETASELQEVSDVSFMVSAGGDMKIKDPATMLREKLEAKERVRAAYRAAEAARETADKLASQFYSTYDVSDNESAFSEWADLSDDEESDDGASR
jgi:hypothetical protein